LLAFVSSQLTVPSLQEREKTRWFCRPLLALKHQYRGSRETINAQITVALCSLGMAAAVADIIRRWGFGIEEEDTTALAFQVFRMLCTSSLYRNKVIVGS